MYAAKDCRLVEVPSWFTSFYRLPQTDEIYPPRYLTQEELEKEMAESKGENNRKRKSGKYVSVRSMRSVIPKGGDLRRPYSKQRFTTRLNDGFAQP